jgi:hypothetical protein
MYLKIVSTQKDFLTTPKPRFLTKSEQNRTRLSPSYQRSAFGATLGASSMDAVITRKA